MNTAVIKSRNWIARNKVRASLFAAGALFVLIVGGYWRPGTRSDAADKKAKASTSIAVESADAARADVPVTLEGLGTVQAFNTVTITTRVDGELQKLGFTEGQLVHKGDLLAQIDPRPYQAALGIAEAAQARDQAQLVSAKQDLDRYTMLAPQNLTSQQVLDAQKATVGGLQAQIKGDAATIDNARTNLQYTTINSPIDGRTGIRKVDIGNNIHATDTGGIVVVTQVQPITLIFTLPEESLGVVNKALAAGPVAVFAMSRDGTSQLDQGTLQLVDNQIDQTTGTIRLKAVFPNKQNTLWPGQFINANVLVHTERNVLTVPTAALQRGPNGMFTFVIKPDSTIEVRPLQIGVESGSITVIKSGLQEGERVATTNQYRLEPGVHVRIVAAASTQATASGTGVEHNKAAQTQVAPANVAHSEAAQAPLVRPQAEQPQLARQSSTAP